MPVASSFNFAEKLFDRFVMGIPTNSCLPECHPQVLVPVLIAGGMSPASSTVFGASRQPAVADKLLVARKTGDIPDLCQNAPSTRHSDSRDGYDQIQIIAEVLLLFYLLFGAFRTRGLCADLFKSSVRN
jgi:hypothetical protein